MDLQHVDFTYRLSDETFERFSYTFDGAPPDTDREGLLAFAKSSLETLDAILERTYPQFDKRPAGELSATSISQGFRYRPKRVSVDTHASVSYVVGLDSAGDPRRAELWLHAHDQDEKRLLDLHDAVVATRRTLSREADVQLKRIEGLRSEPFVVERYLELGSS